MDVEQLKMSGINGIGSNILGKQNVDIYDNSDEESIHITGAVTSSVSVVLNGILLVCFFINRKKAWITRMCGFVSLVASDLIIGIVAILVFATRKTWAESSTAAVLRLVEEAIYFTSKCVTINHLLLICLNGLLHLDEEDQEHRTRNSFHIQAMFIWMTTLSWLVIPVVLLGNECSTFRFAECPALQKGPNLMIQFISFIFACPWILVHVFYAAYLFLSLKGKYAEKLHLPQKIAFLFGRKRMHVEQKSLSDQHSKCNKTVSEADHNHCAIHFGSLSFLGNKDRREIQNKGITTVGVLLLVLDQSVLPTAMTMIKLMDETVFDAALLRSLNILTFLGQVVNPLIYILTMPNLRMNIKAMVLMFGTKKLSHPSPVGRRFKFVSFQTNNRLCSCDHFTTRRHTFDDVINRGKSRCSYDAEKAEKRSTRYRSDDTLIRHPHTGHGFANTVKSFHRSYTGDLKTCPSSLDALNRKQSLVSGRSATIGGLSIEMDSQMSVSDFLSCTV